MARVGALTEDEFSEELRNATIAFILALFLLGARMGENDLTAAELAVISGYQRQAVTSARNFARDLLAGQYETPDHEAGVRLGLPARIALWVTTLRGVASVAQTWRRDDPRLMWVWNPLKEHCDDCANLNGQVHRASEWRQMRIEPQSRLLQCGGWRCGCRFVEV